MNNAVSANNGEIILYQPEGAVHIEVRLEKESVWLTQQQMAMLFAVKENTITYHLKEIFKSEELLREPTTQKIRVVRLEGSREISRWIEFFNLDVIISVGFRVNSKTGIKFRQWALDVIKNHMLKGHSVNQRFLLAEERIDQQLVNHEKHLQENDLQHTSMRERLATLEKQVDFFVKANLPPSEGVLSAKSWWSGYEFACQLVRSAKEEIVVIDPYADDVTLSLIAKKAEGVKAFVYSARISRTMNEETARLNRQFPTVELRNMRDVHDRFIIVDSAIYHVGASIRDLGNKLTAFSVLSAITKDQLLESVK